MSPQQQQRAGGLAGDIILYLRRTDGRPTEEEIRRRLGFGFGEYQKFKNVSVVFMGSDGDSSGSSPSNALAAPHPLWTEKSTSTLTD